MTLVMCFESQTKSSWLKFNCIRAVLGVFSGIEAVT